MDGIQMRIEGMTLARAADGISSGSLSPVGLVQLFLQQIEKQNPAINAFITVTQKEAQRDAREAENLIRSGKYIGPLHGIPIAVKDIFETAGIRTTGGSKILTSYVPTTDAAVVRRLREEGAVIIGKTNLHEWAVGATNINPHFGTTRNPWDMNRVPGGSSGGSAAALAAGMCLGALGTDTGGSIRIPASACGVVGLKPTRGLVSLTGVMPFSWSLDHAGPMALDVQDCAMLLDAICGYDPEDPESVPRPVSENYQDAIHNPVDDLRIAIPKEYFFESIRDEITHAVHDAVKILEKSGAHLSEVPYSDVAEDERAGSLIRLAEGATVHYHDLVERKAEIGPDVVERLERGLRVSIRDYALARRIQAEKVRLRARFFEEFDLLVTPTLPIEPPTIQGINSAWAAGELTRFTSPFNLVGLPAISIPCGFSRNGLPIGLQLVADHWKESNLLSAAHFYEQATSWRDKRPNLFADN
jgi:aspartyl-tRNA(Asn)/glutamyl-tRNA(Gln) amidotransferase subunit A